MTTIYFVRHGETEANTHFLYQGCTDLPLTPNGLEQIDLLARRLREVPVDCIYSSPLRRAWVAAEHINRWHGVPLLPDPALLELCGGAFEGLNLSEVRRRFPREIKIWDEEPWNFVGPGMEDGFAHSFEQLGRAVRRVARNHPGQTVLLSSHGCMQRLFNLLARGWGLRRMGELEWGGNCSYTVAEFDPDGTAHLLVQNECGHIPPDRLAPVFCQPPARD